MSGVRPPRAPYWPDRSAYKRRRSARRMFWIAALLVVVLPWFGYRHVRDWIGPGEDGAFLPDTPVVVDSQPPPGGGLQAPPAGGTRAAAGASPSLLAAPMAASEDAAQAEAAAEAQVDAIAREARAGDGEAAAARLEGLGAQLHREVLLADRGSAVRREAARREVAAIGGVRAAGWIDRMTMLLLVSGRGPAHGAITEACRRLSAHGDVAGLAVRVQEVGGDGSHASALTGECRQGLGGVTGQAGGPFPGVALRAPAREGVAGTPEEPEDAEAAAERQRREAESLRILSDSTPELPSVPQPGADP